MRIVLSPSAQKDLRRLDARVAERVVDKLKEYERGSDPLQFSKRLHDDPDGTHRFKIGDWRAKFFVEKDIIITCVRHRSKAYL